MISRNSIFQSDCRLICSQIESETVDVIFTDPPFNIALKPQRGTHGEIDNDALSPEEFNNLITITFTEMYRVLRSDRVAWVCCNWQCYSVFDTILKQVGFELKTCIVWVKQNWGLGNHFRPQHEFILVAFKGEPSVPKTAQSNVWQHSRLSNTFHPNEKPLDLIRRALMVYNKSGDLLLDPFAGSFSSCVAAKQLGMDYIGCETKPEYFETGRQRLEGGIVQITNNKGTIVEREQGAPLIDMYESMGG